MILLVALLTLWPILGLIENVTGQHVKTQPVYYVKENEKDEVCASKVCVGKCCPQGQYLLCDDETLLCDCNATNVDIDFSTVQVYSDKEYGEKVDTKFKEAFVILQSFSLNASDKFRSEARMSLLLEPYARAIIGTLPIMLTLLCGLSLAIASVSGLPDQRIIGGTETTIDRFPYAVVLMSSTDGVNYVQFCGGSIINNRSILTAASCFDGATKSWRVRVGSSFANIGGNVHEIAQILINQSYESIYRDNDIAVIHVTTAFVYGNNVQAARIGGAGYILEDDTPVTAIGWGETEYAGPASEQLRSVDIWTVDQETCRRNYNLISMRVTANMMCAGYLGVGGRDICSRDYGGPLLHNDVIVGVGSFGTACGYANYPGVYARVGQHADWIVSVA